MVALPLPLAFISTEQRTGTKVVVTGCKVDQCHSRPLSLFSVCRGLEVGLYGTVCHTGASWIGSESYRQFFPEKHHYRYVAGTIWITMHVNALSRGE